MTLKALMKYNVSRRFSDRIAGAQWTSIEPSTPSRGYIHSRRSQSGWQLYLLFMQGISNRSSRVLV
jgi:hypothetical protein